MTTKVEITRTIPVRDGVDVKVAGPKVEVKGKKGSLSREFSHPKISIGLKDDGVNIVSVGPSKKELALMGTWESHINNMMKGVSEGFLYKMKIVYAHFPMKALVKGEEFIVENFVGERHPRKTRILGDTKVQVKGDIVEIEGVCLEDVGQTAANIEQLTAIKGFDPRVFQDGIYIIERNK